MATTGLAPLPDVGVLAYNGVTFNSMTKTELTGKPIKDNAGRTITSIEWTLSVDAYVTLEQGQDTIDSTMRTITLQLSQARGELAYTGKGFGANFVVNKPGGLQDVAWGPTPTLFECQPLGASRSAKVKWQVVFTIPNTFPTIGPLLQFNEELNISYDEDAYATVSIKGTMQIPLTGLPQTNSAITTTVDAYRQRFLDQVANSFPLNLFRVLRRNFNVSRDRRTMEWEFQGEQLPPQGLPWSATTARGRFTVRPHRMGPGLAQWLCSLNCTYTLPPGVARRVAYQHFALLLAVRMRQSQFGGLANRPPPVNPIVQAVVNQSSILQLLQRNLQAEQARQRQANTACFIVDFGVDEGLFLESKSVTFHASWMLFSQYRNILRASGIWRTAGTEGGDTWATSVRNISGWKGTLRNSIQATQDAIVDLQLGPP